MTSETQEWQDASDVGKEESRAAWAAAAPEFLIEAAGRYQEVTTYKELSVFVQERTGIRTTQLLQHWIGDVLARVTAQCAVNGTPNLSSLCVNTAGSVGDSYLVAVEKATGVLPDDADRHAARERLECYRYWKAAALPADGGTPALTPKVAASRNRARKAALEAKPTATCPICNLALPASGECDNCG